MEEKNKKSVSISAKFTNDTLFAKGAYLINNRDTEMVGEWIYYDPYGKLIKKEKYDSIGELISMTDFDTSGQIKNKFYYDDDQNLNYYESFLNGIKVKDEYKTTYTESEGDNEDYHEWTVTSDTINYYYLNGKIRENSILEYSRIISRTLYDSLGNIYYSYERIGKNPKLPFNIKR
jgi:hypothetical protein